MKTHSHRFALGITLTLLLLAASASAEILGVEQFDYSDGPIAGQSGGTFWDFKNVAPTAHTGTSSDWDNIDGASSVVSGRLITSNNKAKREYEGPGEGFPPSDEANGAVNGANVHQEVYYRVTLTTGATLPQFFGLSSYDFGNERIFFGKRFDQANFGLEVLGGASTNSSLPVQPNTNYTLVCKISYPSNTISLFINPDLNAAEPAPHAVADFPNTEWSTAVRLASGSTGDAITWDNLVVATTWTDLGTVVTTTADNDDGSLNPAVGGGVSLREAVNGSPNGTLITFDPALSGQTITLTNGELFPQQGAPQQGALTIDATALTGGMTISGGNASRHFLIAQTVSLTLRGLTLRDGNGQGTFPGAGGALRNDGFLRLFGCTLTANHAGSGGAIHSQNSQLALTRCTVTGNTSINTGGGIYMNNGSNSITHCTVSGNTANGGNGGGGIYLQTPATLTLANTIVAANTAPAGLPADIYNIGGTVIGSGTNLIGQNTSVSDQFPAGPLAGTAGSPLNPKLSPLAYFGGPTMTMHPLIGSPAIDAGGTNNPGGTDQRGFPRFVDGNNSSGAQLDVGALEAGPLRTVTSIVDGQSGTLRDVINSATVPGTHIVFAPGFSDFGFLLFDGELSIANKTLFIDASDQPAAVRISGQNNSRVFNIAAGASLAMHSISIINGKAPDGANGDGGDGGQGGGIQNHGALSLLSCSVSANRTGGGGYGDGHRNGGRGGGGGGIFSDGRLSLVSSAVTGNQTGNGGNANGDGSGGDGGSGGGIANTGPLLVLSSSITGNQTGSGGGSTINDNGDGGSGGGIRHSGGSAAVIQATTVSGNVASNVGGGIDSLGAPLKLIHCTVSGNSGLDGGGLTVSNARLEQTTVSGNQTTGAGGGVLFVPEYLELKNCIIAGNTTGSGGPDILRFLGGPDIITIGANLIGNPADAGTFNGPAPLTGDALLAPLGDYGGPTFTMALRPGSPARDAAAYSEVQQINVGAFPITFTLTFKGQTTGSLNQNSTGGQVEAALAALSTIGAGNVSVTRIEDGPNTRFVVTFTGTLANSDQPQITSGSVSTSTFSNGSTPPRGDQRGFPIVGAPDLGAYEAGTLTNYNAFIWETLPATATEAQHAATFDFDGDGANNEGEYIAGTVVTNAQSVFRVTNTTFNGGSVSITFPSVIGRKYFLETSPDLLTWTPEPAFLVGDGNPLGFNFLLPGNPPRYFLRPRVSWP